MASATKEYELFSWIDQIPFSRPKKNMSRDFSDGGAGIMMAELLKYFHPKLVELHNYSPANCLTIKMNNWTTLNRKVFSKLGIKLHKLQIQQLASAVPGAAIDLLSTIKNGIQVASEKKVERKQQERLVLGNGQQGVICMVQDTLNTDILGVPLHSEPTSSGHLVIAMENMVPQRQLDEKLMEIEEKDEAITILNQKVSHLDKLLQLKDQRIKDLTLQLKIAKNRRNDDPKESSSLNIFNND